MARTLTLYALPQGNDIPGSDPIAGTYLCLVDESVPSEHLASAALDGFYARLGGHQCGEYALLCEDGDGRPLREPADAEPHVFSGLAEIAKIADEVPSNRATSALA